MLHECAARRTNPPVAGKVYERNEPMENFARLLLEHGAPVDARDDAGCTPLHLAAARGDDFMLDLLHKNGADVDARTAAGDTPLHLATRWEHAHTVRKLIRHGASRTIEDADGRAPVALAIELDKPQDVIAATREKACCPEVSIPCIAAYVSKRLLRSDRVKEPAPPASTPP